jgi:hypothetical protein
MYHNCASMCSLCEWKEGKIAFTYQFYPLISGIKSNMQLIIFLCLIVELPLVSGDCLFGTPKLNDVDRIKFGISILT